jgi:hypothetical protein
VLSELINLATRYNTNVQLRAADSATKSELLPHNIEVTPYRYEANPVAVVHLQFLGDQGHPSTELKCLHIRPAELRLGGSCGGGSFTPAHTNLAPAATN